MRIASRLMAHSSGRQVAIEIEEASYGVHGYADGSSLLVLHLRSREQAQALLDAAATAIAMLHSSYPLRDSSPQPLPAGGDSARDGAKPSPASEPAVPVEEVAR